MNIKKHFSLSLGLLTLSAPLFVQADVEMRLSKLESQLRETSTKNARGTFGPNLADGSPNIDGYGFYVSADAVIYKLYEDNNCYANSYPSATTTSFNPSLYNTNFNWNWGFKVGLGYYAEHDFWQSGFEFTYLKTKKSATSSGYLLPSAYSSNDLAFLSTTNSLTSGPASDYWTVVFYNLDWTLGKDFFISKYLSLLPAFGVKTTWFYQQRDITWPNPLASTPPTASNAIQDNYLAVGPKFDLLSKFYFGRNFSFVGGVDVALLYARNQTSSNQNTDQTVQQIETNISWEVTNQSVKTYSVSPYLGFCIGVAYDTNFYDESYNFGMQLTYEEQYYNKASRQLVGFSPSAFDVSLQGVDLSLTFSF